MTPHRASSTERLHMYGPEAGLAAHHAAGFKERRCAWGVRSKPSYLESVITLQFVGKTKDKPYQESSVGRSTFVFIQHRPGAAALTVFEGPLYTGEVFSIVTKRQENDPLGLVVKKDGLIFERFSVCCEYKYRYGSKLGGTSGTFKLVCVAGGSRCPTCFVGKVTRSQEKAKQIKADGGAAPPLSPVDAYYSRRMSEESSSNSSGADDAGSSDSTAPREDDSDVSTTCSTSPVPPADEAESATENEAPRAEAATTADGVRRASSVSTSQGRKADAQPEAFASPFERLRARLEKKEKANRSGVLHVVDVGEIAKEYPDCHVIVDPRTLISSEEIRRLNQLKVEADAKREKAMEEVHTKAANVRSTAAAKRRKSLQELQAKAEKTKAREEKEHRASMEDLQAQVKVANVGLSEKRRSSLLELQAQVSAEITKLASVGLVVMPTDARNKAAEATAGQPAPDSDDEAMGDDPAAADSDSSSSETAEADEPAPAAATASNESDLLRDEPPTEPAASAQADGDEPDESSDEGPPPLAVRGATQSDAETKEHDADGAETLSAEMQKQMAAEIAKLTGGTDVDAAIEATSHTNAVDTTTSDAHTADAHPVDVHPTGVATHDATPATAAAHTDTPNTTAAAKNDAPPCR